MTIKEIVEKYLRENGYEGLAGEDCGCTLDDLFSCDGNSDGSTGVEKCEPAMKGKCPGPDECEWAEVRNTRIWCPGREGRHEELRLPNLRECEERSFTTLPGLQRP